MRSFALLIVLPLFGCTTGGEPVERASRTADVQPPTFDSLQQALIDEHCPWGLPSTSNVNVRQGYVTAYDSSRRIPLWSAYNLNVRAVQAARLLRRIS